MLLWSSSHSCRTTSNENLSWRKKAALNCTITLRGSEKLGTVTLYLFVALEPTTSVSILLKEESGLSVAALDVNPDDLRANQYWSIPGSVQKQGSVSCEAERDDIIISRPFDIARVMVWHCQLTERSMFPTPCLGCYQYVLFGFFLDRKGFKMHVF